MKQEVQKNILFENDLKMEELVFLKKIDEL